MKPEADPQLLLNELEWRRCASDVFYFLETYWKIASPLGRDFHLRPEQTDAVRRFLEHRYVVVLKARQIGWSTLCTAFVFWKAYFHDDESWLLLSRREVDAWALLKKVTYGFNRLPSWMHERGPSIVRANLDTMEFANGSVIKSDQSKNDPARSMTLTGAILDEWAFFENPDDAWASIEPATELGGQVIGLSTANGMNRFADVYHAAKAGGSDFHAVFYPYDVVPHRDAEWWAKKAKTMLPWQMHQEYPRNDVEAFILSGQSVFDVEWLSNLSTLPPLKRGNVKVAKFADGTEAPRQMWIEEDPEGSLQVWRPPDIEHRYVMGIDTAEGLEHGDYSVIWIVDTADGFPCAKWRGKIAPDLLGSLIAFRLGWHYGAAYAVCEVNNHGLSTLNALMAQGYPNIYWRTVYDEATRSKMRKLGWMTHEKSKPLLVDELWRSLREGELKLVDEETISEMMVYTRDEKGRMSGSPHDDQVIAFGLANIGRQDVFTPDWTPEVDITGTVEWWMQMAEADKQPASYRIGASSTRG